MDLLLAEANTIEEDNKIKANNSSIDKSKAKEIEI